MSSSFGKIFTLTTFGESHGLGIGGIIDGCPAGIDMDFDFIQAELDKRKPGTLLAKRAGTNRKEDDAIHLLSGVYQGKTTGTPIAFLINNTNQHSSDYNKLAQTYRPGHGDITYDAKYGFRDPRGGGRSSARETAARVAGGAIAQLFLKTLGIEIYAYPIAIDGIYAEEFGEVCAKKTKDMLYTRPFYAPNEEVIAHWEARINEVRAQKDTLGGIVRVEVHNAPAGLGEPVFDKLDARLACAIMSIGAVKAVGIGDGFLVATSRGSTNNDTMRVVSQNFNNMHDTTHDTDTPHYIDNTHLNNTPCQCVEQGQCLEHTKNTVQFETNHAGGILAGISTGQDIILEAAVKPIPSIAQEQSTVTRQKENTQLVIGGRHDISAIPRIVPVMTAMTALTIADMLLMQRRMQTGTDTLSQILNTTVFPQN